MKLHRIFASIVGIVSITIGVLRFFVDELGRNIPATDGVIHIITGLAFLLGAWLLKGKYVRVSNGILGVFYIIFGITGAMNWPHIILGTVALLLTLVIKTHSKVKEG